MTKKLWLSKTFWFNALNGIFAALQTMGWTSLPVSGEEQASVLIVGNLILRLITKGGVTLAGALAPLALAGALFPLPAGAVSVLASDSDVFTVAEPDTWDGVVAIDTASVLFTGGSVSGNLTLLGQAMAAISGGSLGGSLEVFNDASAALEIQAGTATVDGSAVADGTILASADCSSCTIDAVLADGSAFSAQASVLQNGTIQLGTPAEVPEPGTLALMGFGLLGIGLAGRRRLG